MAADAAETARTVGASADSTFASKHVSIAKIRAMKPRALPTAAHHTVSVVVDGKTVAEKTVSKR
jgi:hypothetical protein